MGEAMGRYRYRVHVLGQTVMGDTLAADTAEAARLAAREAFFASPDAIRSEAPALAASIERHQQNARDFGLSIKVTRV